MTVMVVLPLIKFERNESVYSVLSRAHLVLGYNNPLRTLALITGLRGYKPMSGLPSRLAAIAEALKINKSLDQIIEENTHYPLYKYFLKAEKRESILDAMCNFGAVKSRVGLLRNHVGALESIKCCDKCIAEDYEKNGFAYWHREHLASWVYFCPYHQTPLNVFEYQLGNYSDRNLTIPPKGKRPRLHRDSLLESKLFEIVEETLNLFNKNCASDMSVSEKNYQRLLLEKGICTSHGRVNQREIYRSVVAWLKDLKDLPGFDSLYTALNVERSWAATICTKGQCFHHPLKHIIFLKSLGLSLNDLFQTDGSFLQQPLVLPKCVKHKPSDCEIKTTIKAEGSIRKAANILKMDVTTLCCEANRLKIEYRHRTKFISESIIKSVIDKVKKGHSSTKISKSVGISVTSVNRIKRSRLNKL